jgi:hypothetical protein
MFYSCDILRDKNNPYPVLFIDHFLAAKIYRESPCLILMISDETRPSILPFPFRSKPQVVQFVQQLQSPLRVST